MGLTDGPLSELGIGCMVALNDLSLFGAQLKSSVGWHSSGVGFGTTTVWLKGHFTWKYWHVESQETPQSSAYQCREGYCAESALVTPLSRTVPVSWWLPGPLGTWGCVASLISLSTPVGPNTTIQSHSLLSVGSVGNRVLLDSGLFSEPTHEEDSCEICLSLCLG